MDVKGWVISFLTVFLALVIIRLGGMVQEVNKVEQQLHETETELLECQEGQTQLAAHYSKEYFILRQAVKYNINPGLSSKIYKVAKNYDIEPWVLYNLIDVESNYQRTVVSYAGAVGYTQIKPETARIFRPNLKVKELYDADTNLQMGARYLAYLLDRYENDYRRALAAYNAGPTRHERASRTGEYDGSSYARKVFR